MGIPVPGKSYNNTIVERKDLDIFDEEINQLFKPYNVKMPIFRIQTANLKE